MPKKKTDNQELIAQGKLPPQDIEAEQSVLGAIMIDKNSLAKVADVLLPEDFYRPAHEKIYSVMLDLFAKSQPIDILTVSSRLKEKNELEEIGGMSYLSELVNVVPTSSHIDHYGKIVNKKRILRDLINASYNISSIAQDEKQDVENILDQAEQEIFRISQRSTGEGFEHIGEDLKKAFDRIEELHNHRGKLRGVTTGFRSLDNILSGLQRSDLVILAARPSLGKTSLALDIARNAALSEKIPVGIFSLEMSRDQIVDRLVSAEANVDLWKIRTGNLSDKGEPSDFDLLQESMAKLSEAPIYIVDIATPTIIQMRAMARRLQAETNLKLLIVDYLQLITSASRSDNLVQQMTEISRGLKALARELSIPILALSQLNRSVEQRPNQIPRLSDLRESGSIEQDADVVMFIYREDRTRDNAEKNNIADVIIAKHRNGPLGKATFRFSEQYASFRELSKEESSEFGIPGNEEF